MNNKRNIPIAQPCTGMEEWEALQEPLISGWLTQGPKVAEFETAFAKRHGVKNAIACSSCTTALHAILSAMGIGEGDEVIVPSFTWIATANAVSYCGATPVFADIDPHTYNIDPSSVATTLSDNTKAIIPVHLFGLCANIDAITDVAPDVPIVEDAACASAAMYKGSPAGGLGTAAAFSFHPRKSITTGEGGMVTTNDDDLADLVRSLRDHGASISDAQRHHGSQPYLLPEFKRLGYNYRMTDMQGAVGLVQLRKLDTFIAERQKWADFYASELAGLSWLRTPVVPDGYSHAWQSFVCRVDETAAPLPRNEIMARLQQAGISTRPGTHAVHMQQYYASKLGIKAEDLPHAQDAQLTSMAIPLHNKMTEDDYRFIVSALKSL